MRESLQPSANPARPQLHYLTGLRFLAALCIFFLHASDHGLIPPEAIAQVDLSKSVSFFFVLSGFILSYVYHKKKLYSSKYFLDRILRVWPITFISLLFTLLFLPNYLYLPLPSSVFSPGLVLLSNLFCLQSLIPIPSFYFGYNAVSWSISTELFFYLIFPWLVKFNPFRLAVFFLVLSFFICTASYLLALSSLPTFSHLHLDVASIHGFVYINPIFRLPEFIIGILAFKINFFGYAFDYSSKSAHINYFSALNSRFFVDILCILIIFTCFCVSLPLDGLPASLQITLNQLKSAFGFSLVISLLYSYDCFLRRALSFPPIVFLGRISFGFYLIHQPLMIRTSNLGGLFVFSDSTFGANILSIFCCTCALATLLYYFVEIPSRRIFGRAFSV